MINFKSPIIKSLMVMMLGTAGGQAITLALTPFTTRIFSPQDFGTLGVFLSVFSIITPIAALTYPLAIVIPKSDIVANTLAIISIRISIIFSVFLLLIIVLIDNFSELINDNILGSYIYLFPLVVILSAFNQVYEQLAIRYEKFVDLSKATFFQSIIVQGGKVVVGLFYPLSIVLILFTTVSEGLRALLIKFSLKKLITKHKTVKIFETALVYKDFPKIRSLETLLNAVSQALPVFLLATFFGTTSVGYYSLCRSVLSAPILLVSKTLGDVIYPDMARKYNNGEVIFNSVLKSTILLTLIGIVPFTIIIIFGPNIFSMIFGNEWYEAGGYARWIGLWMFFGFVNTPSVKALPILNLQSFQLKTTTWMLITRILSLFLGSLVFKSEEFAIMLFGISGACINAYLIYFALKKSRLHNLKRGV